MVSTSGNVVEQETISIRGFPSGNEVTLPVKVKAAGKQSNLLFLRCQTKLSSAASRPLVPTQNPTTKSCVDECTFFSLFETGGKTGEQKMS